MKARVDFVSNSSSCSFVVTSSPKDAVKVFNKEFGKTVAWPYDVEGIDVTLTGTKAALDKVKSVVECGTVSKAYDGVDCLHSFEHPSTALERHQPDVCVY